MCWQQPTHSKSHLMIYWSTTAVTWESTSRGKATPSAAAAFWLITKSKIRGLLDGYLGRTRALKDPVDKGGEALGGLGFARPVGHQSAGPRRTVAIGPSSAGHCGSPGPPSVGPRSPSLRGWLARSRRSMPPGRPAAPRRSRDPRRRGASRRVARGRLLRAPPGRAPGWSRRTRCPAARTSRGARRSGAPP